MVLNLRSVVLDASILGEYKFKILGTWCDHWMGRIEESQSEHGREVLSENTSEFDSDITGESTRENLRKHQREYSQRALESEH